jgi:hypothetical protein
MKSKHRAMESPFETNRPLNRRERRALDRIARDEAKAERALPAHGQAQTPPPLTRMINRVQRPIIRSGMAAAFALLCFCFGALASTVTGTFTDTTGTAVVGAKIVFQPLSNPQVTGGTIIGSGNSTVTTTSGGAFTATLKQGDYNVLVNGRDRFQISVPNDSATYSIQSLISTTLTYSYTSPPYSGPASTAAIGNVLLATNVSSGYPVVFTTNDVISLIANSSGGASTTALNNTSNSIFSTIGTSVTTAAANIAVDKVGNLTVTNAPTLSAFTNKVLIAGANGVLQDAGISTNSLYTLVGQVTSVTNLFASLQSSYSTLNSTLGTLQGNLINPNSYGFAYLSDVTAALVPYTTTASYASSFTTAAAQIATDKVGSLTVTNNETIGGNSTISGTAAIVTANAGTLTVTNAATFNGTVSGANIANTTQLNAASNAVLNATRKDDRSIRQFNVANNLGAFGISAYGSYSVYTGRSLHTVTTDSEAISLVYSAASSEGDLAWASQSVDMAASVEINGTIVPVYFGGKRLFNFTNFRPSLVAVSDPINVLVPAGTQLWVRTAMTRLTDTAYTAYTGENGINASDGASLPMNVAARGSAFSTGEGVVYVSTTAINPFTSSGWAVDSGTIAASNNEMFRPNAIIGYQKFGENRSVCILGDSIFAGQGDIVNTDTTSGRGFVRRILNGSIPCTQIAQGGEKVADWLYWYPGRGAPVRAKWLPWSKYIITDLGSNDINVGTNTTKLQADMITLWTRCSKIGAIVSATTILPRTTTTDAFTTTGNQTIQTLNSWNTIFPAINTWLRAGAPITNGVASAAGDAGAIFAGGVGHPLTAIYDTAAQVESSLGSGVWKAGSTLVTSTASAGTTTTSLVDTGATWTTTQNGGLGQYTGLVLWNTTRNLYAPINSHTATTLTLGSAITGQTTGDAYKIVQAWTVDGVHPSLYGHTQLASSGVFTASNFP